MAELHDLRPPKGSRKAKKRLGRGPGSGLGKTSGRGQKGQKSRSGASIPAGFEGGQMPLQRRIPKRGFTSRSHVDYQVVNLRDFSRLESDQVTPESLRSNGLIRSLRKPVKILGMGDVDRPFTVRVHAVSETARSKIEGQGGTVALLGDEAKE